MARSEPELMEGGEQTNQLPLVQREPLLRTKLFVPPIRPNRVSRPRLIEQINKGLDKALILISAPAGYGKTTLVSSWLHETEVPSAWLSLDEGDNDPIRFLQNFIAALQKIIPAIQPDMLSVLPGMQPAPYNAVWRNGSLAGFIDWEMSAPVTRDWDLAHVAFSWVPLHARSVVEPEGFTDFDRRSARLRRLLARYRWDGDAADFIGTVQARALSMASGLRELAQTGDRDAARLVREGHADDCERAAAELDDFSL